MTYNKLGKTSGERYQTFLLIKKLVEEENKTLAEIGQIFACSRQAIHLLLKQNGYIIKTEKPMVITQRVKNQLDECVRKELEELRRKLRFQKNANCNLRQEVKLLSSKLEEYRKERMRNEFEEYRKKFDL